MIEIVILMFIVYALVAIFNSDRQLYKKNNGN